jgi:hypothetical protein
VTLRCALPKYLKILAIFRERHGRCTNNLPSHVKHLIGSEIKLNYRWNATTLPLLTIFPMPLQVGDGTGVTSNDGPWSSTSSMMTVTAMRLSFGTSLGSTVDLFDAVTTSWYCGLT